MTIDIMMPFYGDPRLLQTAVQSVLGQSDPDWRLVVIDDAYPELAPGEWVQALDDRRVVYRRNEHNLGVSGNFRKSVELVEAPYFTLMGCDDVMLPNYVARMHRLLAEEPTVSYVQPGVDVIDQYGNVVLPLADRVKAKLRSNAVRSRAYSGESLARSLLRGNWTYFPSICWRVDVVRKFGFRADLEVALDLALQLEIVAAGGTIAVDQVPSFRYRRHAESVSSWTANEGSRFVEERTVMNAAADSMRRAGWSRAARVARFRWASRLNAATRIPATLMARDAAGLRSLLSHMVR